MNLLNVLGTKTGCNRLKSVISVSSYEKKEPDRQPLVTGPGATATDSPVAISCGSVQLRIIFGPPNRTFKH
jgi:hypothetical protein